MIPSVTQIIGFRPPSFENVPLHILEKASQRGTDVHEMAALYLQGLWFAEIEGLEGYLESLKNWVDAYVEEVIWVEKELVAPKYTIKGHPDALVRLRGDQGLTLLDWKTPKPLSASWRLQLAGYNILCKANGYEVKRVASLRLDANGGPAKFQGYTKTLASDQNVFLSCLNIWNFYNKAA